MTKWAAVEPNKMLTDPEFISLVPIISEKLEIPSDILWKDLIVFLVLRELTFAKIDGLDDLNSRMVFKGGTSLSKCYRLINRFSEDVDLAFINPKDTPEHLGQGRRRTYLKSIEAFVSDLDFITTMESVDKTGGKRITLFKYNSPEEISVLGENHYVKSGVQLEMDFRTDPMPHGKKMVGTLIGDYLRDEAPETYEKYAPLSEFEINILDLTRTLVEKTLAVISTLTQFDSDKDEEQKEKLSLEERARHFYDIAKLWKHFNDPEQEVNIENFDLEVVKDLFIRSIDLDVLYRTKNYETNPITGLPKFSAIASIIAKDEFKSNYKQVFEASPLYFPKSKPTSESVLTDVSNYFNFLTESFEN